MLKVPTRSLKAACIVVLAVDANETLKCVTSGKCTHETAWSHRGAGKMGRHNYFVDCCVIVALTKNVEKSVLNMVSLKKDGTEKHVFYFFLGMDDGTPKKKPKKVQ